MNGLDDKFEQIVATAAYRLRRANRSREVEILRQVNPYISTTEGEIYNSFVGEVSWGELQILDLELALDIYDEMSEEEREQIQDVVRKVAYELRAGIDGVNFRPRPITDRNWRESIASLADSQFGLPSSDPQFRSDVFMLMPFSGRTAQEVYKNHILKVVKDRELTINRGDDFFTGTHVVHDIWSAINAAAVVIADCTGRNPNVFYELGIAHTLGKKTILIAEREEDVPFDLRTYRYIKYDYTPPGMSLFEAALKHALANLIPDNSTATEIDPRDIPF